MATISASVGHGGENRPEDIRTVQKLLNEHSMPPLRALDVDGHAGEKTIAAIRHFQSTKVGLKRPDGRVDPGGETLRMLVDGERNSKPTAKAGTSPDEPKPPPLDGKRRNEFVGGSVREKENTRQI